MSLKQAQKQAVNSSFARARIGAVIVKGGRVLSTGYNELRYSKRNGRPWASVHAEEMAIVKLLKQPNGLKILAGSVLYVSRIKKDGNVAEAKPCLECQELIDAVGIKRVVHT